MDIRVYNVEDQIKVADYFVVASATARPHVKALYNELHVRLKAAGELHAKAEGLDMNWWVLLDYLDVVIHIQQSEAREYYGLDELYGDCPQLDWQSEGLPEVLAPPEEETKGEQELTA
jgi:ribosome-associated protein